MKTDLESEVRFDKSLRSKVLVMPSIECSGEWAKNTVPTCDLSGIACLGRGRGPESVFVIALISRRL